YNDPGIQVVPALVAIICGHVALVQAKKIVGFKGKKLAIGGLILGYAELAFELAFKIWFWIIL
ncbi:DUF4190 domain-containing protein, partial [Syntrophus sp. (in: bacteria)]|uniref:DUF4190 domain-containing protein n=1 Tax=Syntrophus sp. (in: bacteria) TaxID=48412 RepID=UPI00345E6B9B